MSQAQLPPPSVETIQPAPSKSEAVISPVEQLAGLANNVIDAYDEQGQHEKMQPVLDAQAYLGSGDINKAQTTLEAGNDWDEHSREFALMMHQQEQMDAGRPQITFEGATEQLFDQAEQDTRSDEPVLADQGRLVMSLRDGIQAKDVNALEQALAVTENELATIENSAQNKGLESVIAERTKYRDIRNALLIEQEAALIQIRREGAVAAEAVDKDILATDARNKIDAAHSGEEAESEIPEQNDKGFGFDREAYEAQVAKQQEKIDKADPADVRLGQLSNGLQEVGVDVQVFNKHLRVHKDNSVIRAAINENLDSILRQAKKNKLEALDTPIADGGREAMDKVIADTQILVDSAVSSALETVGNDTSVEASKTTEEIQQQKDDVVAESSSSNESFAEISDGRLKANEAAATSVGSIANSLGIDSSQAAEWISSLDDRSVTELIRQSKSPIMNENPRADTQLGRAAQEARQNIVQGYKQWLDSRR